MLTYWRRNRLLFTTTLGLHFLQRALRYYALCAWRYLGSQGTQTK